MVLQTDYFYRLGKRYGPVFNVESEWVVQNYSELFRFINMIIKEQNHD